MAKRSGKIVINEDSWSYMLLTDEDYEAIISNDVDEEAETDVDRRIISFKESKFTYLNVVHELFHVFWGYSGVPDDMKVVSHDIEEMAARLIERNVLKILVKSLIIYNRLAETSQRLPTRSATQLCHLLSLLGEKKPLEKIRQPKS